ncbi:nucleotide exchange factor GrpE [Leucothrix pacifica]|uniref:Protein GrpE n=1 Tax=Leucothrix pacifica TaxID=1247513 RepID=A0A317CF06_9GAMM|nr:nucleotide exchange factor GrpE [Leucothrix pacifica]PWQ97235.1 nucleotide exchange factor GrpE [Leucothrix pacifica]
MSKSDQTPENQQAPEVDVDVISAESETIESDVEGTEAAEDSADAALSSDEIIAQLREKLEATEQKANENWDSFLRLQAEMDNQRKRSEKKVEDAHKFASQKFVEALLPVVDSLEMGMAAEGNIEQIREGMGLTMKQFESVMEKFNIETVNPMGEKFNPELHQAMAMQPNPEMENNTVMAVMQKGFTLSGRLVRPAMVMVVKN